MHYTYKGIIQWFWRENMYGWKTCCYTAAVECRESAALLRFVVHISELVSCIMSVLYFLTLKAVTVFLLCRSSCSWLLLSERQFRSWNSGSSNKQQQLDSPQTQPSSQWRFQIITSLGIYDIAARFPAASSRVRKIGKTTFSLSASLHATTRLTLEGFSLTSGKSEVYFTWRPIYIFDNSPISSWNEKCLRHKLYRK